MLSPPMISAWVSFRYLPYCDEILGDLQRQFPRRLQDQAARHARPRARSGEDIQHRQGEARGLAGAGLRHPQHVAAHQNERDRLFLNRRRMAVAHVVDRAQHIARQAEIGKGFPQGVGLGNRDGRHFAADFVRGMLTCRDI